MVKKSDVVRFAYGGDDTMICFENENIPRCPKQFVAIVILKNGDEVDARKVGMRQKIWCWWYESRKSEIETVILTKCAKSLAPNNSGKVFEN